MNLYFVVGSLFREKIETAVGIMIAACTRSPGGALCDKGAPCVHLWDWSTHGKNRLGGKPFLINACGNTKIHSEPLLFQSCVIHEPLPFYTAAGPWNNSKIVYHWNEGDHSQNSYFQPNGYRDGWHARFNRKSNQWLAWWTKGSEDVTRLPWSPGYSGTWKNQNSKFGGATVSSHKTRTKTMETET